MRKVEAKTGAFLGGGCKLRAKYAVFVEMFLKNNQGKAAPLQSRLKNIHLNVGPLRQLFVLSSYLQQKTSCSEIKHDTPNISLDINRCVDKKRIFLMGSEKTSSCHWLSAPGSPAAAGVI